MRPRRTTHPAARSIESSPDSSRKGTHVPFFEHRWPSRTGRPVTDSPLEQTRWTWWRSVLPALVVGGAGWGVWRWGQIEPTLGLSQDDAYVHLSVARTVLSGGVWGIEPELAGAVSSSPMFVGLLIAVGSVLGLSVNVAIALAVAGAALFAFAARPLLAEHKPLLAVLFCAVGGRVVALVPTGLEHTFHLAVVVAVLFAVQRRAVLVLPLVAAATALRPEGLFLAAGGVIVYALRRQWRLSLMFALGATLSVMVLGALGVWPDTVPDPGWSTGAAWPLAMAGRSLDNGLGAPLLVMATVALVAVCGRDPRAQMLAIAAIAQLAFGRVGNYFRYEAWILASTAALCWPEAWTAGWRSWTSRATLLALFVSGVISTSTAVGGIAWQRQTLGHIAERAAVEGGTVATFSNGEMSWRGTRAVDLSCRTTPGRCQLEQATWAVVPDSVPLTLGSDWHATDSIHRRWGQREVSFVFYSRVEGP